MRKAVHTTIPAPPAPLSTDPLQLLRLLTVRRHLIPLLRPRARLIEIHMRLRIPQFLKLRLPQPIIRSENRFAGDVFEFGHPFADVVAVGVALFGLGYRVEDGIGRFPAVGVV